MALAEGKTQHTNNANILIIINRGVNSFIRLPNRLQSAGTTKSNNTNMSHATWNVPKVCAAVGPTDMANSSLAGEHYTKYHPILQGQISEALFARGVHRQTSCYQGCHVFQFQGDLVYLMCIVYFPTREGNHQPLSPPVTFTVERFPLCGI